MTWKPALIALILLGGVLMGGVLVWTSASSVEEAPDFTVATLDNETFALSEERGHVVVLQFMATWCASCRITEDEIAQVWPSWNASQVRVLSVDVDPYGTEEELRAYRDQHGIPWPMARDTDGVAQAYGVWELGRLLVIDPDGRIVYDEVGVAKAQDVDHAVEGALAGGSDVLGLPRYGLFALAALAGFATFFSPCAIALLPAYVTSHLPGHAEQQLAGSPFVRRLRHGGMASAGLLSALVGIGGFLVVLGAVARGVVPLLQLVVGVLMIGLGVVGLARPGLFDWAMRATHSMTGNPGPARGPAWSRQFWYGVGYAGAASGCVLPVLLQLGLLAALAGPLLGGLAVMVYAATAAGLMIVFAVATLVIPDAWVRRGARWGRFVPAATSLVFIAAGVYLVHYYWRAFGLPVG